MMARVLACVACLALGMAAPPLAQQRRMDQDPARDNLVHGEGYQTAAPGQLGRVTKVGHGPNDMILVAGAGFGGEIHESFTASRVDAYTMYAVTLPGFGRTAAPPMPEAGTSYGEQSWSRAAKESIEQLITDENLHKPVVVGHWLSATQVALRLALDNPDKISAVVIISGVARGIPPQGSSSSGPTPLSDRIEIVDTRLAPYWFKTVTRDTWDDNNFYPGDYARHPVRALQLWRMAAEPTLPTWIRYLCEVFAQDITLDIEDLAVPTLLIQPGLDAEFFSEPSNEYMRAYLHGTWAGVEELNSRVSVETIDDSRVFIMDDQPDRLDRVVETFLAKVRFDADDSNQNAGSG